MALNKIAPIVAINDGETPYVFLQRVFFAPDTIQDKSKRNKLVKILRDFICAIYFSDRSNFTLPEWMEDEDNDENLVPIRSDNAQM